MLIKWGEFSKENFPVIMLHKKCFIGVKLEKSIGKSVIRLFHSFQYALFCDKVKE